MALAILVGNLELIGAMKNNDEIKPVEVFSGTHWETTLVQSLLQNEEIESFLIDNIMGTLNPWHTSPGATNPVKVMVSSLDEERAIKVVDEYRKNA